MYQFEEKDYRLCSGPTGTEFEEPVEFAANEVDGILVNVHCRFLHKFEHCTRSKKSPKERCPKLPAQE